MNLAQLSKKEPISFIQTLLTSNDVLTKKVEQLTKIGRGFGAAGVGFEIQEGQRILPRYEIAGWSFDKGYWHKDN